MSEDVFDAGHVVLFMFFIAILIIAILIDLNSIDNNGFEILADEYCQSQGYDSVENYHYNFQDETLELECEEDKDKGSEFLLTKNNPYRGVLE